tara:strand:+ start:12324 stop:12785 length:462 start_codon:yes stop_codon:yes gene_type:complete
MNSRIQTAEPEQLKASRLKMRMTQQQLADALGVTASHVSKWEKGRVKMSRGYRIEFKKLYSTTVLNPEEQTDQFIESILLSRKFEMDVFKTIIDRIHKNANPKTNTGILDGLVDMRDIHSLLEYASRIHDLDIQITTVKQWHGEEPRQLENQK